MWGFGWYDPYSKLYFKGQSYTQGLVVFSHFTLNSKSPTNTSHYIGIIDSKVLYTLENTTRRKAFAMTGGGVQEINNNFWRENIIHENYIS